MCVSFLCSTKNFTGSFIGSRSSSENDSLCLKHLYYPRNGKSMCRQKYAKISLKAVNDKDEVYDDQFYYPSHCICELVFLKDYIPDSRIQIENNKAD